MCARKTPIRGVAIDQKLFGIKRYPSVQHTLSRSQISDRIIHQDSAAAAPRRRPYPRQHATHLSQRIPAPSGTWSRDPPGGAVRALRRCCRRSWGCACLARGGPDVADYTSADSKSVRFARPGSATAVTPLTLMYAPRRCSHATARVARAEKVVEQGAPEMNVGHIRSRPRTERVGSLHLV